MMWTTAPSLRATTPEKSGKAAGGGSAIATGARLATSAAHDSAPAAKESATSVDVLVIGPPAGRAGGAFGPSCAATARPERGPRLCPPFLAPGSCARKRNQAG